MAGQIAAMERALSFGPFRLLPAQRLLLEADKPLRLGGRALDILIALVERRGELVNKDELKARVWPDTFVEECNLKVHVSALRRALGDGQAGQRYVATTPGRGYCFVAPVTLSEGLRPAAPPAAAAERVHNLPAPLTRMIGHAATVRALAAQLPQHRLITITGAGGIGKTTVALAVAEALIAAYEHGVRFVDLAPLSDPRLVPSALASALGTGGHSDDPVLGLIAFLRDKQMLLVLDNCEQVIEVVAALALDVLRAAPGVHILATSREPLRTEGEHVRRLAPLESPPASARLTATEALRFPAIQLFVERAATSLGEFELSDADAPAAGEICRKLDGIALAIELAAALVESFGVRGIAARLDDRLRLLTRGRRTASPRQHTLRATLNWSYELLAETERLVLRRLAVFPAGFTLNAARAVVASAEIAAADVDERIANLVTKSLLTADVSGPVARYRVLDTTRAFAIEKLAESGELAAAARRHAEFYRDLFAPAASTSELQPTIARLALYCREIDNVRATLDWAFSSEGDTALGVVLTAAYVPVWLHLSLLTECRDRAERALDNLAPDSDLSLRLKVQLLTSLGIVLVYTTGVVDRTGVVLAKALDVADGTDDADLQLHALYAMWIYQFNRGEHHAAQLLAERFSRVAPRTGDSADLLVADRLMGSTLHYGGNQPDAQRCYERVLDRYSAPTDRRHAMWLHYDGRVLAQARLARVLWLRGFMDQADQVAQASLADALAMDHKLSVCSALGEAVCPIQLAAGDIAGAERSVAMLTDLATGHSFTVWTRFARCLEGKLLIKRGEVARGSVLLRAELDAFNTHGQALHGSGFVGDLAEGLASAGQLAEASVIIEAAFARSDRDGVRWHVAELLRIKGELLLQDGGIGSTRAAEDCFLGALEVAQRQGALFWELRAALSLACLKARQGRQDEARKVLAPVYDRFTEGFETADLCAARALLETLPAHFAGSGRRDAS